MPQRSPIATIQHLPAPIGGLNAIDSIATMPPTDSVQCDNLFPETSYLRLRRGSTNYYTVGGTPNPIRSLMTYSSSSTERLLAAIGGQVLDISTRQNLGVGSGFNSDVWQYVNFATPGGQFLVLCNGADANHWTWAGPGTQMLAAQNSTNPANAFTIPAFSMVTAYAQRLYFCCDTDLYLYYLEPTEFQGVVARINLGQFLTKGGNIACIGTWTRDNSTQGMQDMLVIVSTHGEVLVYNGTDPDSPSDFSLQGRFEIGRPVSGHRQLVRVGPDMLLICEDGFQALANYLALGESKALTTGISRKIGNTISDAIRAGKELPGWEAILYPANNALIINVPVPGLGFQQYAVNTITGSWCRFLGLQAWCWTLWAGGIYFGSNNGTVIQASYGGDDNGRPIPFELVTSFQVLGGSMTQKRATMCRPFIIATGRWYPVLDTNVDYTVTPINSPLDTSVDQPAWDNVRWNEFNWASGLAPEHHWQSVQGIGMSFAIHMAGTALSNDLQLLAFDLAYESGIGFL